MYYYWNCVLSNCTCACMDFILICIFHNSKISCIQRGGRLVSRIFEMLRNLGCELYCECCILGVICQISSDKCFYSTNFGNNNMRNRYILFLQDVCIQIKKQIKVIPAIFYAGDFDVIDWMYI